MSTFTPAQLEEIKARHDVVDYAARLVELQKIAGREWAGPCPKCGGTDRLHVHADGWWFCRTCHPKRSDVIGLEMLLTGANFPTACEALGAQSAPPKLERRAPELKAKAWRDPQWQDEAERITNTCALRLDTSEGDRGRTYLAERGIDLATAQRFIIGYSPTSPRWKDNAGEWHDGGPALVLPYLRRTGANLQAIRYRRLNAHEDRYSSLRGSEHTLFGVVQSLPAATLVLIEGEINAMSVWQAAHDLDLSVASFGSQTLGATTLKAVSYLSSEYKRVIVWCDQPEAARKVREAVSVPCTMLESPKTPSKPKGYDGNDLLVAERLRAFMQRVIDRRAA